MLFYKAFPDEVFVYWDLPANARETTIFRIFRDGTEIAESRKTHVRIGDVTVGESFSVSVLWDGGTLSDTVTVPEEKRNIDVSRAPYFAVGDGKTMNTAALQRALDDCTEKDRVYLPRGTYLTGSLFLTSDTELYLAEGATLQGTAEPDDYLPKIASRFEGTEMVCHAALLNIGKLTREEGITTRNVTVRGHGTVASGGADLCEAVIARELARMKAEGTLPNAEDCACGLRTVAGRVRPRLINISSAENVTLSGIGIERGASWNVHMIYSKNVLTRGCRFLSEGVFNGDGWDPDSSENCTLYDSDFNTGDDSVAVKSGKNPEGNRIGIPCRNIRVFDCRSAKGHGITVGSEMSGGVEDVRIWDCDLKNSLYGVEIKGTGKRGGYVRGVSVRRSAMPRLLMHAVTYNDDGEGAPEAPVFSDCTFSELTLTGRAHYLGGRTERCPAVELSGFDADRHAVKNIRFSNVRLLSEDGAPLDISLSNCRGVSFENIECV